MMNENKTLEYYNKNADNFAKTTINVDFCETQNRFLARCCRSTDIYWILAVVQEEIQNIFWNRAFMLMPQTVQRKCVISQAITQEYKSEGCYLKSLMRTKNMMAYGPARQYFIFLRMNLKPFL